jgi:branched-chain amino acid transport system permease protein
MRRYIPVAITVLAVVIIQLVTAISDTSYYLTQLTMSAYYALVAVGLCLLMGYAGQISLGQAGFFAIGGYTAATLTTIDVSPILDLPFWAFLDKIGLLLSRTNSYGDDLIYINPWVSCVLAIIITLIVAIAVGKPVLALRGHYLAMATLGFGTIIYRIVLGTRAFGEADGISNVPGFQLFPGLSVSGNMSARVENYYVAWAAVVIGMVILVNLINSRVGRSLRALHGNEEAADAMGVNTARLKLNVFIVGAMFASIAGILLTHYNGGIGPSESSVTKSVRYVAIVAVGGMANVWGTLIMSVVLNFLSLRGVFGSYDDAVFGLVLIGIMLFAPEGFLKVTILAKVNQEFKKVLKRAPFSQARRSNANPLKTNGENE